MCSQHFPFPSLEAPKATRKQERCQGICKGFQKIPGQCRNRGEAAETHESHSRLRSGHGTHSGTQLLKTKGLRGQDRARAGRRKPSCGEEETRMQHFLQLPLLPVPWPFPTRKAACPPWHYSLNKASAALIVLANPSRTHSMKNTQLLGADGSYANLRAQSHGPLSFPRRKEVQRSP